jgi:hypothetical protein
MEPVSPEYPRGGLSRGRQAVALVRSALATERAATFAARELAARLPWRQTTPVEGRIRSYRARKLGCEVGLRHGTPNVALFFDIMVRRGYAPPAAVMTAESRSTGIRLVDLGANIGLFPHMYRASYRCPGWWDTSRIPRT